MPKHHLFARDEVFPSWFANAIQEFLSGLPPSLHLRRASTTTVEVLPVEPQGRAALAIQGRWRYRDTTVARVHPGGAAGAYSVWAVATDNVITNTPNPFTDTTDYSFDLRITAAGTDPSGTGVEIFERIGELHWDGAAITELRQLAGRASQVDIFKTGGTWTKPTGARLVHVICVGGGGGGGSGGKGAADSGVAGGHGGGGGGFIEATLVAEDLPDSVAVAIGSGGAGGAARTANSSSGAGGASGGITSFGDASVGQDYVRATGGQGSSGNHVGGTLTGGNGATAKVTGDPGGPGTQGAGGGGAGGGVTVGAVRLSGQAGGTVTVIGLIGGTGGAVGATGGAGQNRGARPGGGGGGGGAAAGGVGSAGAAGGAGGAYGGGGGGGGAAVNDEGASGAGGRGGDGVCVVVTEL